MVKKRNGTFEEFKFSKIEKMLKDCAKGLDINLDLFAQNFMIEIKPNITTEEIQQKLIQTANKLFTKDEKTPYNSDYSKFANRLFLSSFQKQLRLERNGYENTTKNGLFKDENDFVEHLYKYTVEIPVYDINLFWRYLKPKNQDDYEKFQEFYKFRNEEEYKYWVEEGHGEEYLKSLYKWIKAQQITIWDNFFYQTLKLMNYLATYNGKIIETPEEMWLLISLGAFQDDMYKVKEFWKYLSKYCVIPATPQLLNFRKLKGGLSSCNIFQVYDNLDSIMDGANKLAQISKRAGGVGIFLGRLRPSGSYLMNKPKISNHINTWVKIYNQIVVAVNQGGLRKGACTVAIPIQHKDVIEFINIRNPVGEERLKAFDIFPQIVIPDVFMKCLENNENFYLFDNYELEKAGLDLIDATGEVLEERYKKAIDLALSGKLKNYKVINSRTLAKEIFRNWTASGLPYIFFEDNANRGSQFKEKIHCANLCVENYSPFPDDYIHSCNLISLNLPALDEEQILNDDKKLQKMIQLVVEYMNKLIDYVITDAPEEKRALEGVIKHNKEYRTIGIGFIGLADLISKYNLAYRQNKRKKKEETIKFIDRIFGKIAIFAVRASLDYPQIASAYEKTKQREKLFAWSIKTPEDEKNTAKIIAEKTGLEENFILNLIADLKNPSKGLANTMLLNSPPNTSTSIYAGSVASILPTFRLIQNEEKKNYVYQTFPRYIKDYFWFYEEYSKFDAKDLYDIIDFVAEVQKWIDSGISFEIPVNHNLISESDLPEVLLKFFYKAWKKGIKALYYIRNILPVNSLLKDENENCVSCAN